VCPQKLTVSNTESDLHTKLGTEYTAFFRREREKKKIQKSKANMRKSIKHLFAIIENIKRNETQ